MLPYSFLSLSGSGIGVVTLVISLFALLYFERYRGIATGLKYLGSTVAAIAYPQAAVYLEGKYGYRGALLLFGGISLHAIAICILLKSPPWSNRAPLSYQNQCNGSSISDSTPKRETTPSHKTDTIKQGMVSD